MKITIADTDIYSDIMEELGELKNLTGKSGQQLILDSLKNLYSDLREKLKREVG